MSVYYPLQDIGKLNQAVVCCARCNTAVFILPKDVTGKMLINDVLGRSEWVAPQPKPKDSDKVNCAKCNLPWSIALAHSNFRIKEGDPDAKN